MPDNYIYYFIAFIVVDFLLVSYILWRRYNKSRLFGPEREYLKNNWARVENMFKYDAKAAIVEADKLLDYAMRVRFKVKASVGQNLKSFGKTFSDLNSVWKAHKLRNSIVHELNYNLSPSDAALAKMSFHRALVDLGM